MSDKNQEVYRAAHDLFSRKPDWAVFYREVLGVQGIVRKVHTDPADFAKFEQTEEYAEIQQMLTRLRERPVPPSGSEEPTRVITVRLPKSLHEALQHEAHEHHTSMNKLCISKLLQVIDEELIPTQVAAAKAAENNGSTENHGSIENNGIGESESMMAENEEMAAMAE